MGKLHKIRHDYNKLTSEEKKELFEWADKLWWSTKKFSPNVDCVIMKCKFGYMHYIKHLLSKDGLFKKKVKIVQRVSRLFMRYDDTFTI